jgi:hypothetical protein
MKRYMILLLILVFGLMASPVMADISFSGSGSGGGSDTLGHTWQLLVVPDDGTSRAGTFIWGVPGYGLGEVTTPDGTPTITDFHFETLFEPITNDHFTINQTGASLGGLTSETRFQVGGTLWIATFTGDTMVDFVAPSPADYLIPGTPYFVNIDLLPAPSITGLSADDFIFTARYSTAVPEPMTLLLLGLGLVGLAGTRKLK